MSIVKKSFLTMTASAFVAVTNLVIGIVLARALSTDGFGRYAVIVSSVTIMAAVAEMRIGNAAIFFINNKGIDRSQITTDSVRAAFVFGLLLLPLLIVTLTNERYFGPLQPIIIAAIAVLGFAKVLIAVQLPLLVGKMNIGRYVIGLAMPNLVLMILLGVGFVSGAVDLGFALGSTVIANGVGAVLLFYFTSPDFRRDHETKLNSLTPLLKYGALINISYVVMLLGTEGSLLLLNYLVDDFSEVGFYRLALRLASVVMMAVGAVSLLLYAKFAETGVHARNRQVERTSRVYWFFLAAWVILLNFIGEPLINALYGQEYRDAAPILGFVALGIAMLGGSSPVLQLFYSNGMAFLVILVHVVNLCVLSILMFLLVPKYSGLGAGISFAVSNAVGLAVAYAIARSRFGIKLRRCLLVTVDDFCFAVRSLR